MGMRMPSKCKAAGSALVCVCLCGAVVIRICSNHIQPPLFSQSETNSHTHTHSDFHDVMVGKTTGFLQCCGGRNFFCRTTQIPDSCSKAVGLPCTVNPGASQTRPCELLTGPLLIIYLVPLPFVSSRWGETHPRALQF